MTGDADREPQPPASFQKRLLWFAALWLAGVATLALAAWLIRKLLPWPPPLLP